MAYYGSPGAGAGAAGGDGGGKIELIASQGMVIDGSILSKGGLAENGANGANPSGWEGGDAGNGGSSGVVGSSSGGTGPASPGSGTHPAGGSGNGGNGGGGSGGGILLKCTGLFGVTLTGTVDTRGGGNNNSNYGTLKVFARRINTSGATFLTGHASAGGYGTPLLVENQMVPLMIM